MRQSPDFDECVHTMHALSDYLSRELDAEQMQEIEEHLEFCELCMQHYRFEQALVAHIRKKAQEVRAPDSLRGRVLKMLDEA